VERVAATEAARMAQPTYQQLHDDNRRLDAENRDLRAENAQLKARIAELESQVQTLLHDALDLRDRRDGGELFAHGPAVAIGRLNARLARLLAWTRTNADNERLANHRDDMFTFLIVPGIDATSYRAELAMRLAATLRKTWGGNRTWAGARAQAVLMTVWATGRQLGLDAFRLFADLFCGRRPRLPLLRAGP